MSDEGLAFFLYAAALESDLRILFNVEEVGVAKVGITLLNAGIDAGGNPKCGVA